MIRLDEVAIYNAARAVFAKAEQMRLDQVDPEGSGDLHIARLLAEVAVRAYLEARP